MAPDCGRPERADACAAGTSVMPRMRLLPAGALVAALFCPKSDVDLQRLVSYPEHMRTIIAALLIVLFAGVHTAAAYGDVELAIVAGEQTSPAEVSDGAQSFSPHHMKCCETSGKPGAVLKISGCSADCVSLHVDPVLLQFHHSATLEAAPQSGFTGGKPLPHLRPPRNV